MMPGSVQHLNVGSVQCRKQIIFVSALRSAESRSSSPTAPIFFRNHSIIHKTKKAVPWDEPSCAAEHAAFDCRLTDCLEVRHRYLLYYHGGSSAYVLGASSRPSLFQEPHRL